MKSMAQQGGVDRQIGAVGFPPPPRAERATSQLSTRDEVGIPMGRPLRTVHRRRKRFARRCGLRLPVGVHAVQRWAGPGIRTKQRGNHRRTCPQEHDDEGGVKRCTNPETAWEGRARPATLASAWTRLPTLSHGLPGKGLCQRRRRLEACRAGNRATNQGSSLAASNRCSVE